MQATKAAPTRLKLTKKLIEQLPRPDGSRQYLYDQTQPKLAVCITPTGSRVFYCVRKFEGKTVRVRLGAFPDISLERAREMCEKAMAKFAAGENPQQSKRAARGEWTLQQGFAYYIEHYAQPHKKSWRVDEQRYERHLKAWKGRRLPAITQGDIERLHSKVGADCGHYEANRLRSLLGKLFQVMKSAGAVTGENFVWNVPKFKEHSRDRFLQADELPGFFGALDASTLGDYFKLCLLTGARRSNVGAMRWEQLALQRGEWRIPTTKNDEWLIVHLSTDAIQILQARQLAAQSAEKPSDFVFPSRKGTKTGHLVDPMPAWRKICKAAGLENLRIHDLRRTLGSWQAATGASLPIIGKSLGHKSQAATAIYSRLNIDPVRESVDKATSAMMLAATAKPAKKRKGK